MVGVELYTWKLHIHRASNYAKTGNVQQSSIQTKF